MIREQHENGADKKTNTKFFIFGSIILISFHILAGYLKVPQQVIDTGLSRGLHTSHIKIGYTLGIFFIFAIIVPIIFILLSLPFKKRRDSLSIAKLIFWSLLITLFFNLLIGFIAPKVI